MKFAKAEKHIVELSDGAHEHVVLVIDDPCYKEDEIPDEVSSFTCENDITLNGIRSNSGKLIFAVLHEHTEYNNEDELYNIIKDLKAGDRFYTPYNEIEKSKKVKTIYNSKGLKKS